MLAPQNVTGYVKKGIKERKRREKLDVSLSDSEATMEATKGAEISISGHCFNGSNGSSDIR